MMRQELLIGRTAPAPVGLVVGASPILEHQVGNAATHNDERMSDGPPVVAAPQHVLEERELV